MVRIRNAWIYCIWMISPLFAEETGFNSISERLFHDLELVQKIDHQIKDRLPLMVNYQLQGGYFTMPSARTFDAGVMGFGYSYLPPYRLWNLGFQFFDHVETTGTYWIYHGISEGNFGHMGFGDDAERTVNLKLILLRREDGFPLLPNFAVGWNDFLGTCRFNSFYTVATQQFLDYNFEATLGWGQGRIQGFFGGLAWTPFRNKKFFLKGLTLAAEYDANNYRKHAFEHPEGRHIKTPINVGAQLQLWDMIRLTASSIRGDDWAASAALHYNIGASSGLFPKIYDPPTYTTPVDTQPLGDLRGQQELAQELAYAFKEQGFDLYTLYLIPADQGKDSLWMKIINVRYREEDEVRKRIEYVLGALTPSNIATVTTVIEADGVPTNEYRFRLAELQRFSAGQMGEEEFRIAAPMREATPTPSDYEGTLLYQRRKPVWVLTFRPWFRSFFGSRRGKFKSETGFLVGSEGYILNQIYYSMSASYTAFSSMQDIDDCDMLNPSRIINVRTDALNYNKASSFHLDQAYLQKSWNWGAGWFSRVAAGYFETAYAGVATETLYYPVNSNWAIGVEAATVWKRSYFGVGFQKIRQFTPHCVKFYPFTGVQYFVDFYYEFKPLSLDFKFSAGQFLARDKGIRIEGSRTFFSGLRVGLWYTLTNGNDSVNNSRYYDKGFFISMPLDFFLNKSSRTRLNYAMSAWLRDVGAQSATGKPLYPTLYWERDNTTPTLY